MPYTTQALIESYRGTKLTTDEARYIKVLIEAVGKWIEGQTGRIWTPSPANTARYFDGGEEYIFLDPVIDIDSVEYLNADGSTNTLYDATVPDYLAYPLNDHTKTSLKRIGGRWPRGSGRIKVTGKWGERDGIPQDIQHAATVLATDWLNREDKLQSESIEGYSRTFRATTDSNAEVNAILESRKRVLL